MKKQYTFRVLQILTYFWTILFMGIVVMNPFLDNRYTFLLPSLSVIYGGMLAIYVSHKEFNRWHKKHRGVHSGELFVFCWTAIIFFLFIDSFFFRRTVPSEVIGVYLLVLSFFALSQTSKSLHVEESHKN